MNKRPKYRDRGRRDWYQLRRWRRIAKAQLRVEPLCRMCLTKGLIEVATIADHIEPHGGDWNRFLTGKLQSLCARCHSGPKHELELHGYHTEFGVDGWPKDPNHPVNR